MKTGPKNKARSAKAVSDTARTAAGELLRAAGLKVTGARLSILEVLQREHGPFTLEELRERAGGAAGDLVTLYRNLAAFQKGRLVRRCDFGDGPIRFELAAAPGKHHHHHVVCTSCREVRTLDACVVERIEKELEGQGYTEVTHSLEFFAVCARCAERAPRVVK